MTWRAEAQLMYEQGDSPAEIAKELDKPYHSIVNVVYGETNWAVSKEEIKQHLYKGVQLDTLAKALRCSVNQVQRAYSEWLKEQLADDKRPAKVIAKDYNLTIQEVYYYRPTVRQYNKLDEKTWEQLLKRVRSGELSQNAASIEYNISRNSIRNRL